ncbi:MAG: DUF2125 domain-containing protein [Alphaproteobacteria bacterium]|nr:DUF2125 domain-containing protein [Alphaproteobacteria bacterium]
MTDATPATPAKKRSVLIPLLGIILFIAVVGFFASRAGLDKARVKQHLDDFIAHVKESGKAQGRDIEITYGELEVVGSFAAKHVVVHDPVFTIQPSERSPVPEGQAPAIDALRVTTPTLEIYPEVLDVSALRVQLPDPINFAGMETPETSLLLVKSNLPLTLTIGHKTVDGVPYTDMKYQSPSEIALTYLREHQVKGEEDTTPQVVPVYETLTLAMAQGSGFTSSIAADASGLGRVNADMRDIVLTPQAAPEGAIKIAQITGEWSNLLNDKKLNVMHAALKAGPVTSDNTAAPYLPVTLDMDATYEGAVPKNAEAIASIQSPESVMTLTQFSLTSKEASAKATASFTANADDVLPVGSANIAFVNAPFILAEMRKYGLLNENNEGMVNQLLLLLTGTPVEQLTDVVIPIERARGGAFKIGQTTFEELFAVLLKEALQKRPAGDAPEAEPIVPQTAPQEQGVRGLVPTLPPADKPRAAPIEVPDHGVRG